MNKHVFSAFLFVLANCACKIDEGERYRSKIKSAQSMQERGDLKAAMHEIDEALIIEPVGTVALYQKGMIYLLQESYDSAIEYCNKSIATKGSDTAFLDLNPNMPVGHDRNLNDIQMKFIRYCRGFSYYMLDKDGKALEDFEFCLSEGFNNNGSVFLYAGTIYINKGLLSKGCNYLDLAILNGNVDAKKIKEKSGCK